MQLSSKHLLGIKELSKEVNQIAKQLGYSESTIRHETIRIYELFKVRSRKEAVIFAYSRKLIQRVGLLLPLLVFNLCDQF